MTKRSSTRPLPNYTFFTDRDLGLHVVPDALEAAGASVERHDKHFPNPRTRDTEWIAFVAAKNWIALTRNRKIRYATDERDAVMQEGLRLFILFGVNHARIATNLVRSLSRVTKYCDSHVQPFIAKLHLPDAEKLKHNPLAPGSIETWLTEAEWRSFPR